MRRINYFTAIIISVAALAVSALAQSPTPTQQPATPAQTLSGKIGWIDTGEFALEKTGITRFISAFKKIGEEVKPLETELLGLQNKMQAIADEIKKLQNTPPNVPIPNKLIATKREEGEQAQREYEFKKKNYDATLEKLSNEYVVPVQSDIGMALQEYLTQKGYIAILDIDKLAQSGIILALEPAQNITKDFINYYNNRKPPAATASVPK